VLDHRQQRIVVAIDVEHDDRLVVILELLAADDFEELLERSEPDRGGR
jgi:hypothetical protein